MSFFLIPEPKMIPSPTLPAGWEKRLDNGTHRYYYINHNRGTTQWEAPTMKTSNQSKPGLHILKLQKCAWMRLINDMQNG